MLPDEKRDAGWLRDYGYIDFGRIEADIAAMETFGAELSASVRNSYAPHLAGVTDAMSTRLPDPPAEFIELVTFLYAHNDAQNVAHQNVYNYANGTQGFANAAADIGEAYRGSDAFAQAKVADVDRAFERVGITLNEDGL